MVRVAQGQGAAVVPPSDGRHSPVTFLRTPRSSSSQVASEPGSAAQECPVVLSAARSATQARSWPSASTSCHQDEALKAATSSASPQAGKGRRQAGSLGPPTGYGMGGGTGFGSQNCGLISGEMTKNTFVEYEPLLREGSPAGRKGGGEHQTGCPQVNKPWGSLTSRGGRSPVSARMGPMAGYGVQTGSTAPPHPPFGVEPIGKG